jgi:hypothetical protein
MPAIFFPSFYVKMEKCLNGLEILPPLKRILIMLRYQDRIFK